jgi:hypothetical protein
MNALQRSGLSFWKSRRRILKPATFSMTIEQAMRWIDTKVLSGKS